MMARTSRVIYLTVLVFVSFSFIWILPRAVDSRDDTGASPDRGAQSVLDPPGTTQSSPPAREVIGLVFYGRREFVSVLDCYLKRNMRDSGGMLDRVIFSVRTEDPDDLAYLDELLNTHPKYSKYVPRPGYKRYIGSWEAVQDPQAIYIKIDDDVSISPFITATKIIRAGYSWFIKVFVEDSAIETLTKRLDENPQYFAASANVINNPALSWVHYRLGVYEPFWPEMNPPKFITPSTWRTSALPSFSGPPDGPAHFSKNGSTPAPYKGHRWLPHRSSAPIDITTTPSSTLTYDPYGPGLLNWAAAAQTHSSFLYHLEKNETDLYRFNIWDFAYVRLSINFFAIRGSDVIDVFPFPEVDDEEYLTCVRPREVGRHVVVDGGALAVHFAFRPQRTAHAGQALEWTDLLSRYADFSEECVCPFPKRENGPLS